MLANPAVGASGLDLHWLWEDRCAGCHGHAGDFARNSLGVSNGELLGRHYVHDLRRFLHNHYLAGNEVDAVYAMLYAQASSQTRFRDECSSCHENAATFVRNALLLRDGALYSRASGQPVREVLVRHRNLKPGDVDFFAKTLVRVAREIYRP
jgi:hypothetical protein